MKCAIVVGLFAMTVLMDNASAATLTCPPVQSIQPSATADGRNHYEASQLDGRSWVSNDTQAPAATLADLIFHHARYDANAQAVICTYENSLSKDVSVSLTLAPVAGWNLTPIADWRGTYCESADVSKCAFTHQQ